MAITFFCNICQDQHTLPNIRALPCGHTNCASCLSQYIASTRSTRGAYPCPNCRAPFRTTQPHPIFLEHVNPASQASIGTSTCHSESFHRQVASAVTEATRLETDQRRQTVQRAAEEIGKVSQMMDHEDCLLGLLNAVVARWRGMIPLFNTIASQSGELSKLKGELREANEATERAERIAEEAFLASEQTLPTLEKARSDLREATTRVSELEEELARKTNEHKAELKRKEEHVGRLHDQLQALKAQERKQKETIRTLREKNKEKDRLIESSTSQRVVTVKEESQNDLEVLPPEPVMMEDEPALQSILENNSRSDRKRKYPSDDGEHLQFPFDENSFPDLDRSSSHSPPPRIKRPGSVSIKPPTFSSGWQLPLDQIKPGSASRKLQRSTSGSNLFPALKLDAKGKPLVPVHTASRRKAKF